MTEREEIITKYSRLIASRYRWYGWISGFVWISALIVNTWIDRSSPLRLITAGLMGLGLGFTWYIFEHRYKLLYHLSVRYPDAFERVEAYLVEKKTKWEQSNLIRIGCMAFLCMVMLMMLLFFKDNRWTMILTTLFITLLLAFIIKGWLDFQDEIVLQDIRHYLDDDQTSE